MGGVSWEGAKINFLLLALCCWLCFGRLTLFCNSFLCTTKPVQDKSVTTKV